MGCTTCSGNPNTWCTQCMPAEDTWVAPVDKLPDVFMGDRDHMYLLPNGDLFILSPDRTRWIKVNGQGGGVTYDDTAVINRLKALEGKTDNFISTVGVSRNGNRVKLTYTLVDGTIKEVEFEDKDTVALAYDDTALKARVKALEDKPDNDKQTLAFNSGNRNLSISNGNSVTLPNDKQTISKQGNKLILSDGGGEVELPVPNTSVPYDDTALKKRVSDLEARPDNDKQTLTVNNNTLSISGGNSVTLPSQSIHRFYDGDIPGTADTTNTRTVQKTNFRNPDGIKVGDTVEDFYSDQNTINRGIWKVIEVSGNNVKVQGIGNYSTSLWKNLTFNTNTRELSLSGGNKVTLPQYVSPQEFNTLKNEYNQLKGAFEKLLQDLKGSGAWKQTGGTIFEGNLYPDRHIATGNINLFGGTVDGNAFIRTNNGKTENDLAGGIN